MMRIAVQHILLGERNRSKGGLAFICNGSKMFAGTPNGGEDAAMTAGLETGATISGEL